MEVDMLPYITTLVAKHYAIPDLPESYAGKTTLTVWEYVSDPAFH